MGVISKLAPCGAAAARRTLGRLRPAEIQVNSVRFGGGPNYVMQKRPGQLVVNRIKDAIHFYMIGIGALPFAAVVVFQHIIFGPCELKDYPDTENGEPAPHHWQFERTPLRQLAQWVPWMQSDIERVERELSYFVRQQTIHHWRKMEQRVVHLQGERWDYKGFYYQPVSANWVDYSKWAMHKYQNQYEKHGYYNA